MFIQTGSTYISETITAGIEISPANMWFYENGKLEKGVGK